MGIRCESDTVPATVSLVRYVTDGYYYFKIPLPLIRVGRWIIVRKSGDLPYSILT